MMNNDPLVERYQDFRDQETWLLDEIEAVLDRAVDESKMTRCQVAGVLMDVMLTQLGRPASLSDDRERDLDEGDGESWRQ